MFRFVQTNETVAAKRQQLVTAVNKQIPQSLLNEIPDYKQIAVAPIVASRLISVNSIKTINKRKFSGRLSANQGGVQLNCLYSQYSNKFEGLYTNLSKEAQEFVYKTVGLTRNVVVSSAVQRTSKVYGTDQTVEFHHNVGVAKLCVGVQYNLADQATQFTVKPSVQFKFGGFNSQIIAQVIDIRVVYVILSSASLRYQFNLKNIAQLCLLQQLAHKSLNKNITVPPLTIKTLDDQVECAHWLSRSLSYIKLNVGQTILKLLKREIKFLDQVNIFGGAEVLNVKRPKFFLGVGNDDFQALWLGGKSVQLCFGIE